MYSVVSWAEKKQAVLTASRAPSSGPEYYEETPSD
jgi:hypothetical protein